MSPSRVQQHPRRPQPVGISGRPRDGRVQVMPTDQPPEGATSPDAKPRLSFAVPVAIGLALTGAGTTALLVHIPAAWLLPHALVTRTTQIGATSDGAALVFAAQDLTWTSAAVTVATGAVLSAVVVLVTSAVLNRVDSRT